MRYSHMYKIPEKMEDICNEIFSITDRICKNSLDNEYAELCRKMASKLARKRPSPLIFGKPELWASGILYCIAEINFLFDKTQVPHMTKSEFIDLLPVSKITATKIYNDIWDKLELYQLDPEFTRPSKLDNNPMAWMAEVDGFIVDIRTMPKEYKEIAFKKGIIPYIPEEKK